MGTALVVVELLLTVLQKISASIRLTYGFPQVVKGSFNRKLLKHVSMKSYLFLPPLPLQGYDTTLETSLQAIYLAGLYIRNLCCFNRHGLSLLYLGQLGFLILSLNISKSVAFFLVLFKVMNLQWYWKH